MIDWLLENSVGIAGIIFTFIITYHVYFLSKESKLEHKERIKQKAEEIEFGREIYFVNIKRYFKNYPNNEEKIFSGYSHVKAEFKTTRFDGIEFFCGIKEVYKTKDGRLTLNSKKGTQEKLKVFEVGVIPYKWIELIDLRGDEHGHKPLFYCYFKGKRYWKTFLKRHLPFGYPYKKIVYYREKENYREDNPIDMKYQIVDIK